MITISIVTLKWITAALATIAWVLWCRWDARNNENGFIDLSGIVPTFVYLVFWIIWLIIF